MLKQTPEEVGTPMGHKATTVCPRCGGMGYTNGEAYLHPMMRLVLPVGRRLTRCGRCNGYGTFNFELEGVDYLPALVERGMTHESFLFPTEERLLKHPEDTVKLAGVAEVSPPTVDSPGERALVVQNSFCVYQIAYGAKPVHISGPGNRTLAPSLYASSLLSWFRKYKVVIPWKEDVDHERPDPITLKWAMKICGINKTRREKNKKEE